MQEELTGGPEVQQPQYIRYDPAREDYSLTESELTKLRDAGQNYWKDFCLVSFPIGIVCSLNAISATEKPFVLSLPIFLNYLFGVVGIFAGIIFAILWHKTKISADAIVNAIKNKPKYRIELRVTESETAMVITPTRDETSTEPNL